MNKNNPLYLEQVALEKEMHDGGIDRWHERNRQAVDNGENSSTDWNVKLTKHFIQPLADGINAFCEEYEGKRGRPTRNLFYLSLIPAEEVAFITIRQMLNAISMRDTSSLQVVCDDISSKIEDQVRFSKLRKESKKTKTYIKKIEESLKKAASQSYRHKRNVFINAERKVGADRWVPWPKNDKLQLGVLLVKLACELIELRDETTEAYEPIFTIDEVNIGRGKTRKSSKIVSVSGQYASWVSEFINNTESFHPEVGPCVIPPRNWVTPFNGGFHTPKVAARCPLVKAKDRSVVRLMTQKQMPKVYRAVNALQTTAWCVNTEVLDILQEIVEKRLPLAVPDLDGNKEPNNPLADREDLADLRGEELKLALTAKEYDDFIAWKRKKREWHDDERSRVSNVIDLGRTRKIAEKYAKYDNIYFCYSLDFRGRIYARASGLSPQGRDIQKGLLRFSNRKALGTNGHYWFKIHGANKWGYDKDTFTDRILKVEDPEFIAMCKSIANDPVKDKSWIKADKPWQFLAWCFEYVDFQSHIEDSEDKTGADFQTFIACAMDGSCSGIQHYSAMLRDEVGGRSVNLIDSSHPNDIYGDVAKVAETVVAHDRKWGEDYSEGWLDLGINRSLCKKSVMTLPYGSTKLTCRDSIGEYIDEQQKKENKVAKSEGRKPELVHSFEDGRWEAEGYMANILWDSIGEVVIAARAGMSFIRGVAREVAKRNEALIWTTPTGFIVKQEIFKTEERRVDTTLMGRISFVVSDNTETICPVKMQSGAAPNYIHSMDSSHLVLSICDMLDAGITDFWVIHDDFGTHACQTGHLHKALRRTMVEMYTPNVLKMFKREQERRLHMEIEEELPEYGNLDLNEIYKSTYIFS